MSKGITKGLEELLKVAIKNHSDYALEVDDSEESVSLQYCQKFLVDMLYRTIHCSNAVDCHRKSLKPKLTLVKK